MSMQTLVNARAVKMICFQPLGDGQETLTIPAFCIPRVKVDSLS